MTPQDQFRHECEARAVLQWDKERRKQYYDLVKKNRGEAAAEKLIGEVKRQWKIKNSSQQSLL